VDHLDPRLCVNGLRGYALYACAEIAQALVDALVATVDLWRMLPISLRPSAQSAASSIAIPARMSATRRARRAACAGR